MILHSHDKERGSVGGRLSQLFLTPCTAAVLSCAVWFATLLCIVCVQCCTKEKHEFVSKIFKASGISHTNAALPACLQPTLTDEPKTDMLSAQKEAKMVIGQVVEEVLSKTGEQPGSMFECAQLGMYRLAFLPAVVALTASAALLTTSQLNDTCSSWPTRVPAC